MSRKRRNRALATLTAGALLASVGGLLLASSASSTPDLPPVSAARLVASVLRAAELDPPVSGHVATHVDIGLPQLPDEGPQAGSGAAALLSSITGDHDVRVWRSNDGFRINELLPFGERSITAGRNDAWAWDSSLYTAYHLGPFPSRTRSGPRQREPEGAPAMLDPVSLARRALSAITPSTSVSVGRSGRIAGRDAYVLVLAPRTPDTLIGRIEVSIDAEHRVPLRGAVFARGAPTAAVSAAFTSVAFDPVDPSVFRFRPPPGAKVVTPKRSTPGSAGPGSTAQLRPSAGDVGGGDKADVYGPFGAGGDVRTFGRDWATIVAVRVPPAPSDLGNDAGVDLSSFLPYSGPLLSIRLVRRGGHDWVAYGSVPQTALARVEQKLP